MVHLEKPTLLFAVVVALFASCRQEVQKPAMNHGQLARTYFQEDAGWYLDNVPFFECSDKNIEQVYYYRWKLFKAHLRNVGAGGYVVTEFINHVPWDREPFCTINAASMHHIYEGRWLRDPQYMDGYINYLYNEGGNNRRYSESIADAAWARHLVDGDTAFIISQLDSMVRQYQGWDDHWDPAKQLYYIAAMPDATEYNIASIDGSGGTAGFDGGEAFRPTINSYMAGNALAISKIASLKGDPATARAFQEKATALKANILQNLWSDSLRHFIDRYQMNNAHVRYWHFIRGRELAGFAPWYFNLPDNDRYTAAWQHALDTTRLLGRFGMRTNEPSYEHYFKQFVYFDGKRGSQWNGPSWPFQTSIALTGMANVLHGSLRHNVTNSDYLKLLRLYTQQHVLPNGKINLVENYDPNLGGPIVHYYWSNHYNHSSYNNLIITGLAGILPSGGDTLTIHPLVDESIRYFYLDNVNYHGHTLAVVYDREGDHYKVGKGVTVWVDGKQAAVRQTGNFYHAVVGAAAAKQSPVPPVNHALNIARKNHPAPSASINTAADSLYQAIDGRMWYFPDISNRWTTEGSTSANDWYALNFGQPVEISKLNIYPYTDNKKFGLPDGVQIEYASGEKWISVKPKTPGAITLTGNTRNTIAFEPIQATQVRIRFAHTSLAVAVSEVEFIE